MVDTVTIRVDGLQQLGVALHALGDEVATRVASSATGAAAKVINEAAKGNIRHNDSKDGDSIDTGSLLGAVISKKIPKSQARFTAEHIVTVRRRRTGRKTKTKQSSAPHAIFVEYGTINMPAEPFLRPAMDHNVQKAVNVMKDRLAAGITRAAKKAGK